MRFGPPTFALLCGLAACCAPSSSQGPSGSSTAEVQAYLSRWHETGRFEGVVLVAQGDSVLYQGAFGMANREWAVPHTMETRFDIGSISKQFTTVLTLQLVTEGILKLDDPITDYLPEYRADTGSRITVDHLLRQASGIPCYVRDWRPTPEERARGRPRLLRRHLSPETLIRDYMSGDLLFEPGSRYYYSNTNHFLLARIIENVTGRSFEENLEERILEPLGLEDTGLLHPARVIPHLASGYVRIPEGEGRAPYYYPPSLWGTGGMYSTAQDLHAWNRAMEEGGFLPDSLNALLFTPFIRDEEGFQHAYAVNPTTLRLELGQEPTSFTGFSGAIDGFRTDVFRYPDSGYIVVILDNAEHYEHWRMAPGIYLILTGHDPEMPQELASRAVAREALALGVDAGVTRAREVQAEPRNWSGLELMDLDLDEYASRYLAIDRGDEALLLWELQVALAPDSPDGWRNLAAGHTALGQDSLASEAREQADLLTRRAEELMALLDAEEYEGLRERIGALASSAGSLALFSSSDIGPRFGRAFQEGDLERARRIAEIWALGNPATPGPHFSLANVYKAMGDTVRAIQCYRRILELQPEGALGDRARAEIALLGGNGGSSGPVAEQDAGLPITVWYLGHCGFAVQVGTRLLVFDYLSERGTPALDPGSPVSEGAPLTPGGGPPAHPGTPELGGLKDGVIDSGDLEGLDVHVFVTHPHTDHYDPVILNWAKEVENIHYYFGWKAGESPDHHYLVGPRATAEVDGMEIYTINSHHSDVPEVAFLVHVDGRWIYHNGDYQQDYLNDFQYLETLTDHLDLVFHVGLTDEQWQYTRQGYWLMEHFHPDAFFPMHFGGEEERGEGFARVMAERGYDTLIPVPRRRGDSWRIQ